MHERDWGHIDPSGEAKEAPQRGDLYFLWHPCTEYVFSGYGLIAREGFKDHLVGILMVDRPRRADPEWLQEVEAIFRECCLVPVTATGERGIVCQMQIEPDSLAYLRPYPGAIPAAIETALGPLLANLPSPAFTLRWDERARAWCSRFSLSTELPRTQHRCNRNPD